MTYDTWVLQLKLYLMLNGFMSWDDATRFLSMFDLKKTWSGHETARNFFDKYARV